MAFVDLIEKLAAAHRVIYGNAELGFFIGAMPLETAERIEAGMT
jgi:hypothetical protein